MPTPRVFIIRHGETEWSLNGKHTGTTELPLTENGERRIRATGKALIGDDRLIVPRNLAHIYVSPRDRAQRTLGLLSLGCSLPWDPSAATQPFHNATSAKVQITKDIREWDYGDYEGITSPEIRTLRKSQGLPEKWDIWKDGCPGGESPEQVEERVDRLILDIRERFHEGVLNGASRAEGKGTVGDVLVVAHGHILRAFAMRWVGKALADGPTFLLEAGGVGTLSYEHGRIEEPAILLGGGFMVEAV